MVILVEKTKVMICFCKDLEELTTKLFFVVAAYNPSRGKHK